MDIIEAAKIARSDLCLAICLPEGQGGVCKEWYYRFHQSIRLLTEALGDREEFAKRLAEDKDIDPEILYKF